VGKVTGTVENVADLVEKVAGVAEKEYEKLPNHEKLRNNGIFLGF
jgi:hypothetical protein